MAVLIIDSRGRRAGLPGKGTPVYTVGKYGGMMIDDYPIGTVAYRSTDQTVAASAWATVMLDAIHYPSATYGMPGISISNGGLLFQAGGTFLVTANIKFSAIGGSSTVYQRYRLGALYNYGEYNAGNATYAPNQYEWIIGGSGCIMDIPAGNGFILQVSHSYSSSLTLLGGIESASISIGRLSG